MLERHPGLAVLRHRGFARYALCRFATTFSWQILGVAVGWQVYALTHDALALGFVGLFEFLPFVALVLVGGQVADRVERRTVLIGAWLLDALCVGGLALLTRLGRPEVWPIYLAVAIFGATRAFWAPAMQATVPNLVPREEFSRAVALNSTLFQVSVIAGPALGGVLFVVGPAAAFALCSALFVLAALIAFGIRPLARIRDGAAMPERAGHTFLSGLRYVLHQRVVLGVISLDLFAVLFGGATALLPLYASEVLRVGPIGLGLLRSAPGVGAAITAAVLTLRPVQRHAGAVMFGGVALFGVSTLVFGASRDFPLSLAALLVLGAGDMLSVYVRAILVQVNTPDAIRGRVSAINSMFIGTSNELGEFESGVTARWFGAVRAVILGGALTLAVVVVWMGLFPQLRRLDALHRSANPPA